MTPAHEKSVGIDFARTAAMPGDDRGKANRDHTLAPSTVGNLRPRRYRRDSPAVASLTALPTELGGITVGDYRDRRNAAIVRLP